jgi:hypothetical protein
MEPQAFQIQQYMHLSDRIMHVDPVGIVGLKTGTVGKKRKIISELGIALCKTYGVG